MEKPTWHRVAWSLLILLTPCVMATDCHSEDEVQSIRLTRNSAIARAIRNNIDLRVRALDSSLAENSIQSSESIYNPSVTASLDYGRTNVAGQSYGSETSRGYLAVAQNLPTGGNVQLFAQSGPTSSVADPLYDYTDWSSSVGLTVYQPLLKNAGKEATELTITQDRYTYAASLAAFKNNVTETVFAVISDYNRLYVLHQLLQSKEAAVQSARQLLEEIRTTPGPGHNAQIDLSNIEYALSQRQTELIEAERQVSSKEASLRYLIGLEGKTHIIPIDPPSAVEPAETERQAIALALEKRPDLSELRIQLQSSAVRQKVSRHNLWPDLSMSASGGFRGYAADGGFSDTADQIGDNKGAYWSAGLRLTIPLGNDLAQSEYRRNKLRSEQLQNQLAAAEWKVRDAIQDDNRSLISARLQVRATAKSKQLAAERVAQYQKNRRLGSASVKDLLDAENDLIAARNLELNAVEVFAFLVARLWKDSGVLLERQNIHIDTSRPEELASTELPADAPPESAPLPATGTPPAATAAAPPRPEPPGVPAPRPLLVPPPTASPAALATYTLALGTHLSSELAALKKALAQAGLVARVTEGPQEKREAIRLFLGNYPDLPAAQRALDPLQGTASQGFVLKNASRGYDAYAGSYFSAGAAQAEQRHLAARGIELTLKNVTLMLPTFVVTAGRFPSQAAAQPALAKLGQQGVSATIVTLRE